MFSKIRFQKVPPKPWSPFKGLDAALGWLELTPIDTQYPAFSTGDSKPEEEIHVIEGYPLVLVNSGEVLLYGLRVLKFGDFDDLKKFFSFFRAEPCFKMPPTAVQVKRNLQTTVPPDEQVFTEKGLVWDKSSKDNAAKSWYADGTMMSELAKRCYFDWSWDGWIGLSKAIHQEMLVFDRLYTSQRTAMWKIRGILRIESTIGTSMLSEYLLWFVHFIGLDHHLHIFSPPVRTRGTLIWKSLHHRRIFRAGGFKCQKRRRIFILNSTIV